MKKRLKVTYRYYLRVDFPDLIYSSFVSVSRDVFFRALRDLSKLNSLDFEKSFSFDDSCSIYNVYVSNNFVYKYNIGYFSKNFYEVFHV